MNRVLRASLAALAVVASPAALASCAGTERVQQVQTAPLAADEAATYEYVIPNGTGVALAAGQTVDLMPATLEAKVGESIRIINRDDEDFMVGPFFVKSKATVAMRFTREGTLVGTCDMNASGEITIHVTT